MNAIKFNNDITTKIKWQVLEALSAQDGGYMVNNPNLLIKHYGVKYEDFYKDIKATPSWIYDDNGFNGTVYLSVSDEAMERLYETYPIFDIEMSKDLLEVFDDAELEEWERSKQMYKMFFGKGDAGYKFIKKVIQTKKVQIAHPR